MTHNDRFIAQLEDYLDGFDGATPLPDRVRDAIRAELPSARQVRPRPGLERASTMLSNASAGARLGMVAAVAVVAVVLGGAFLNNSRSGGLVGGGPTPVPSSTSTTAPIPTPTPTPAPSAAALPPSLEAAPYTACDTADTANSCLAPGTYRLSGGPGVWPMTATIDVPAGWFGWEAGTGWDAVLVDGGPEDRASGWGVQFATVGDVFRDPCDRSMGTIAASDVATPQQLAEAISSWPGFTASATSPITVDGRPGLELTVARKTKTAGCPGGTAWMSASNAFVDAYPFANGSAYPTTLRIVDTGAGLIVIRAMDFARTSPNELTGGLEDTVDRHAGDRAELRAIVDSVRLTPSSP